MGNSYSIQSSLALEGPDEASIHFFRTIQVKYLKQFAVSLSESTGLGFDINDTTRQISWRDYFRIFSEIKDLIERDKEQVKAGNWHPATKNFQMERAPIEFEEVVEEQREEQIPDDYTEDEESDISEDESADGEEGSAEGDVTGSTGSKKRKNSTTPSSSRKSSRVGDDSAAVTDNNDPDKSGGSGSGKNADEENKEPDEEATPANDEDDGSAAGSVKSAKSAQSGESAGSGSHKSNSRTKSNKSNKSAKSNQSGGSGQGSSASGSGSSVSSNSSSSYSSSNSSSYAAARAPKLKGWDPNTISPIFFGYGLQTVAQKQHEEKEKTENLRVMERRAVEKARNTRSGQIGHFEKSTVSAREARQKQIDDIIRRYETATKKREEDIARAEKSMNKLQFSLYKAEWQADCEAADEAYETESTALIAVHKLKTEQDSEALAKKKEELEAFKDVEQQEMPAAERLEEIARLEMGRLIDVIDHQAVQMDIVRREYVEIKEELTTLQDSEGQGKEREKQIALLKSMVNVSETRVKEKQKDLQNSLSDLNDAEVLLARAVRAKQQQDKLLPLFRLLTKEKCPSSARLDLFLAAVTLYSSATLDQKFEFFSQMFNSQSRFGGGSSRPGSSRAGSRPGSRPGSSRPGTGIAGSRAASRQGSSRMGNVAADNDMSFRPTTAGSERPASAAVSLSAVVNYGDCYSSDFVCRTIELFHETLRRLDVLFDRPSMTDIEHTVRRAFMSLNLDMEADLSQFEFKLVLRNLFSTSKKICTILGVDPQDSMSTYQRVKMKPFTLFSMGMIDQANAKTRIHVESTKYYKELAPENKLIIHEQSLAMGVDDPNCADYSRYIQQPSKKIKSGIPPLDHGHLSNFQWVENRLQTDAIVKIQALMRAISERKLAELAAKYQAFMEAKDMAVSEMRDRVMKEFRKRENVGGVGKMKWDAQVRMRQAKERATGQHLSRAECVLLMMEEAIDRAKDEIEERFKVIASKEDFAGVDFSKKHRDKEMGEHVDDINAFGVIAKSEVEDDGQDAEHDHEDGESQSHATQGQGQGHRGPSHGKKDDDTSSAKHAGDGGDGSRKAEEAAKRKPKGKSSAISSLDPEQTKLMIMGKYERRHGPGVLGERAIETDFRLMMANPTHEQRAYFARLRGLSKEFTEQKTHWFTAELPTKPLLIQMVLHNTPEVMAHELEEHFKITRSHEQIVDSFQSIVQSDMEYGIIQRDTIAKEREVEAGLKRLVIAQMKKSMENLNLMLESRLRSAPEGVEESDIMRTEMDKATNLVTKYEDQTKDTLVVISRQQEKFRRTLLSFLEMKRRHRCVVNVKDERDGVKLDPQISTEERRSWVIRLNSAIKLPNRTPEDSKIRNSEIRAVCREFFDAVQTDAVTIVNEYYLPKYLKTIAVTSEDNVDGRTFVCGRGHKGKTLTYEYHNVIYKVIFDDNGVFNGSDEWAMKAAGNDRLGSLEYFKCHIKAVNVPLTATIDYHGFRVLAVAKLPTDIYSFNDEGELRKVTQDMLHGVVSKGDNFVNVGKVHSHALKQAGEILNLAEHLVRGGKDINNFTTHASSEMKCYSGYNNEFYLKDFWRSFPSESPKMTPHLSMQPREQSVFWRQLRPEFVKHYEEAPLSPDAYCLMVLDVPDRMQHVENVEKATVDLIKRVIPHLMEMLSNRSYVLPVAQGLGLDLTLELHCRGVNMRHLGLMRYLLWHSLPGTVSLFHNERGIRTSKDLREEVQDGDIIQVNGIRYVVTETKSRKITHKRIPIADPLKCESEHAQTAYIGHLKSEKNCSHLRAVLLGEMVARTLKHIIRLQLRQYAKRTSNCSGTFMRELLVHYFNVLTGSDANSDDILQEVVYTAIRERFGKLAVKPSEKPNLQHIIKPVVLFIIKRLQVMFNVSLTVSCIGEFHERPVGFCFNSMDLLDISPVLRHNCPLVAYADAELTTLAAKEAESSAYVVQVLADKPSIFYTMFDRKGSRAAENKGTLGVEYRAIYSNTCELEQPGAIITDPFSRSVAFRTTRLGKAEGRYHPTIAPQNYDEHFSVEVFAQVQRGKIDFNTVYMNGRYALMVNRQGWWSFVLYEGMDEVFMKIAPVVYDQWTHIIATYDGVTLRIYIDARLCLQQETAALFRHVREEWAQELNDSRIELQNQERYEKTKIAAETELDAEKYYNSKVGQTELKAAARSIVANMEFMLENAPKDAFAAEDKNAGKKRKAQAMVQAKQAYKDDLYIQKVKAVTERFAVAQGEVNDKERRYIDDGLLRKRKPLRIGASSASADSGEAKHYFNGCLSCLSIYPSCLTADRVRIHFLCSRTDKGRDAQRLHSVAAAKYAEALLFAPDDQAVLKGYAISLCEYLKIEITASSIQGVSTGKLKILGAIEEFQKISNPDGIAEILLLIPPEAQYANLVCAAFNSIVAIDKSYFTRGRVMTRKDLVPLPRTYALDHPSNNPYFIDTAASIYREVVRDVSLSFSYGEMKLDWLADLHCSELVVALIKHAFDDASLDIVQIGAIFKQSLRSNISITDEDVSVLAANLLTSIGFDFTGCNIITNESMLYVIRVKTLKILTLDGCVSITDEGVKSLEILAEQLEVFSFAGCIHISDNGLECIGKASHNLTILNANNCPNVTHNMLILFAKKNKRLNSLHAATCYITDEGMSELCTNLSPRHMTSLDVSFCREITDYSILSLAQSCPALQHLNLCGLSRVSTSSMQSIITKCWFLKTLVCEDMFLLTDEVFYFDSKNDGRQQAEQEFMHKFQKLNLRDCVNITDDGIKQFTRRCRQTDSLVLRGCDKLTDRCFEHLIYINPLEGPHAFTDALRVLDISFCSGMTSEGLLLMLRAGTGIEELNISGMVSVTDDVVNEMCKVCPTLIRLKMARCTFLTDAALCHIADYLWLDEIDVSFCHKITDDSIEVLTAACNGLAKMNLRKLSRLTDNALTAIGRNCTQIRELDIRDCNKVADIALSDLYNLQKFVKIYR